MTEPMDDGTLAGVLAAIAQGVAALEAGDLGAPVDDPAGRIAAAAEVQDLRRRLGDLERDLVVAAGQALGKCSGELDGGRQFTLQRASDRKAWDHEDWKRDTRRAIVQRHTAGLEDAALQHVNLETGEVVELTLAALLHQAIAEAQEVHGSTAPRSTALKALGLYATDYCESSPAGWRLTVTPPPTTPTTTEKDA